MMTDQTTPDASDRLAALLNDEQLALLSQIEREHEDRVLEEFRQLVDAFARHHPGLEVAIQGVADHIVRESVVTRGCACVPARNENAVSTPTAPADATPKWPEDGKQNLLIDDRLELLAGLVNHLPGQRAVLIALAQHIAESGQDWPRCCTGVYPELKVTLL